MTPEERPLTIDELDALGVGAVVLDHQGYAWQRNRELRWSSVNGSVYTTTSLVEDYHLTLIHPAPVSDHSMCARPREGCFRTTIAVDVEPVVNGKRWVYPAGHRNALLMADDEIYAAGGAIPEPELTVVERAAEVLEGLIDTDWSTTGQLAEALAAAGLLKDDEQ